MEQEEGKQEVLDSTEHEEFPGDLKIPTSGGVLANMTTLDEDGEESPEEVTKYKSSNISIKYENYESVKGEIEITTK
jgi:hypothetical protein